MKDNMTYSLAIKTCQCLNDFDYGKQIICENNLLDNDNIQIKNTLIDFCGHYGDINYALNIFNSINDNKKDIITINSMMSSYLKNGNISEVNNLFRNAINNLSLNADASTCSILLNGCSAINIYIKYIKNNKDKKIKYNHYIITCLVECFARKGHLNGAFNIIRKYQSVTKRSPSYAMCIAC